MPRNLQPVSIDGINFDAFISSNAAYQNNVPSFPVEAGFEVTDAIITRPVTLDLTLVLSNNPVTFQTEGGNRVLDAAAKLRELYFKRRPVTVITEGRTYSNMAIVSLNERVNSTYGDAREVPVSFKQILTTRRQTMGLSFGAGATGVNAGNAKTSWGTVPPGSAI